MSGVTFRRLGEGIWDHCRLISFYGAAIPHRMTIIRLRDNTLLLHSPTHCDEPTKRALNELGRVAHIAAPNAMHDLFLQDYAAAFPQARIWIPPGTRKYFSHVPLAEQLPLNGPAVPWHEDLSFILLEGIPRLNECVFYHPQSSSLIFADLFFNIGNDSPMLIRIAARLGRFYRRLATPPDIRWFLVRDRVALRRSIQKLRALPFENIIIGHGSNIIGSGSDAFDRAIAWLG
jgi:uncharacterized protein DUF4336